MQHFHRIATGLPVQPLLDQLAAQPALWDDVTARQEAPGSAHHDTRCIFVRGPQEFTAHSAFNDLVSLDREHVIEALPAVKDLVQLAFTAIDGAELARVMLAELRPDGAIDPHADQGAYAERFSRFHVALQSDEGNTFYCGGESVHMAPGELWWFNHQQMHYVANASARPRIHLIIDARVAGLYRRT